MKRLLTSWEPRAIGSLCVIAGCTWLFLVIAGNVLEGDTHAIDTKLLQFVRTPDDPEVLRGPRWMKETIRDITALGGYPILTLTTLGVVGFLSLAGHSRDARYMLTAVAGGWLLAYGLKSLFGRPRPEIVPHLSDVVSSSFPSGHSLMSAVVYLTIGSMLTNIVSSSRLKCYFLGVAALLALLVGLSRLGMGVHFPSDVVAGWCLGLAWAEVCWLVHHKLIQKSHPPADEPSGR